MHVTFAPHDILQIDDARIIFRNFEGKGGRYNREGDRNFAVVIPDQEVADALIEKGWNVKIKPPRDEDDSPFIFMSVKVKFNGRGPAVYLRSGSAEPVRLGEDEIGVLDNIDIASVDMDIRPYDWKDDYGESGRTAYLQAIHVTQNVDRFASRYNRAE